MNDKFPFLLDENYLFLPWLNANKLQGMQELLNRHLQLLNTKMEESRKLMKDNILLHEQLQKMQAENDRLKEELKQIRATMAVDHRAGVLSNVEGNRQTKAWIDRLVQEIDICLESLNR